MILSLIYPVFYYPLLGFFYLFRKFHKKWDFWFEIRQKKEGLRPWLNCPEKTYPLWFHCSSGEYEYAKPVIRKIREKYPRENILVTYFSPSVKKSLSESGNVDFYCPTPWDTHREWKKFINHHKPKALLIARTDLWPMMVLSAKKANIPCLLFSKTVGADQKKMRGWIECLVLKQMNDIFCVSREDRQNLAKRLYPFNKIHVCGDTRYDQCFYRCENPKKLKPLNNFNRPVFVAGSTWPGDEDVLLPFFKKFSKQVSFILVPHEPNPIHLKKLIKNIKSRKLEYQFYTQTKSWNPFSILIVDKTGILADIYAWGQFAFVGGSMNKNVHSVMEPLAQGQLTFLGPKHLNNREALTFKKIEINGIAPVQIIKNTENLTDCFSKLWPKWKKDKQFNLKLVLKEKTGASEIILRWIKNQKILPSNQSKIELKDI